MYDPVLKRGRDFQRSEEFREGMTTVSQNGTVVLRRNVIPIVSVVIPCRNEIEHIERCLRSILVQERGDKGFIEVIVADGMSDDGSREILKQLAEEDPRLRVIDNPRGIVSTGLNAAIRAAKGKIIMRMDAHNEYASNYISECLATLEETGADNVGGPWIAFTGRNLIEQAIAGAFQSPFAMGGGHAHDPLYEGPLDTVYLGCWPSHVFDRFGLFDEELVRNQDDEFNLRLTRGGGKIWQSPRIKSRYRPRASLKDLWRQCSQYGYWKVRLLQKYLMPASVRQIVPGCFVLALTILTIGAVWSSLAALALASLLGIYLACNFVASVLTASKTGWKILPLLPFVFACYHFAYGYGCLRGVFDFIILRKGPDPKYAQLTRVTSNRMNEMR